MGLVEKKLGRRCSDYRKRSGLTQAKLAEKIGVATETISRLERGAAMPSLSRMESLCDALGIELHDLFRLRARETLSDRAIDELVALVRRRPTGDIELMITLATRFFEHLDSIQTARKKTKATR